jgi:choline monooxygenase
MLLESSRLHPTLPDLTEDTLTTQPIERAFTAPSTWYTSGDFHAFDREAVEARHWQYVGHVAQVNNAGDHAVASVAGEPILVVRGKDDVLRAFYNVCRHRAGPLALENGTCSKGVLQCKYHGWTYTLDGMLRGVPHWDRVDLFDKKDYGLTPVALEVWQGLMFVNLSPAPAPLEDTVQGIAERIAPLRLDGLQFHRRVVYPVKCNWKAYVDNYLEGYHVPIVHPELNKVLDYAQYRTETSLKYSLQYSPFKADADASMYGDAQQAFYYFVFPNMMLNIVGHRLQVNLVVPTGAQSCEVIFDYLYLDASSEAAQAQIQADFEYSEVVQREDEEICEQVQIGLNSRSYSVGRYSVQREEGVHHFHDLLRTAYRQHLLETQRPASPQPFTPLLETGS